MKKAGYSITDSHGSSHLSFTSTTGAFKAHKSNEIGRSARFGNEDYDNQKYELDNIQKKHDQEMNKLLLNFTVINLYDE